MSDQKIKSAAGKVRMDLIPLKALQGAARVFEYGSHKYAKGNWHTATDDEFTERYVGGALRHLTSAQNDDGTFDMKSLAACDAESGQPELDHILCGLIMLRGLLTKRGVLAADPGLAVTADPVSMQTTGPRFDVVRASDVGDRPRYYMVNKQTARMDIMTLPRHLLLERLHKMPIGAARAAEYWAIVDNYPEGA